MNTRVTRALVWLKQIFSSEQIEYQIVGGLAATVHGGSREVADIDLYICKSDVNKILPHVAQYISKPLARYTEYGWDLEYLQLVYENQKIEIGLSEYTRIQSHEDGTWHLLDIHFAESVIKPYQGLELSVIPIHRLVQYKRILGREVDLIDIEELTSLSDSL
ncbi:MazG-related protein [Marinomonas sp. CT5]|uniref:MazG-related protein n=1 Tax=Marinomonas sp. CT5 TaxID=2066133 RepID=UPI001BAFEE4C|nr:MazG-related protein [Marinomonas sp. CT5]QUX96060.1 MazG-related protein [Marinomonas sp. CT5]